MTTGVELDKWVEKVKRCEYLAEDELKALCDYVRGRASDDAMWVGCMQRHPYTTYMTRLFVAC
jgi:hypothetical protein